MVGPGGEGCCAGEEAGGSFTSQHQGSGVMKMLLRKPHPLHGRSKRRKTYRTASAVWKPEGKALFFFEEFLPPQEPIPTHEVTGGHIGSCSHRDFSPPLVISLCSKQKEKTLLCTSTEDWGRACRQVFCPSFFNIEFIFTFCVSKIYRVALAIPTSSN